MNKLSILIVEDNPADVLLITEYLAEKKGVEFNFKDTDNLESAIGLLSQHDFDVILLDLFLPDSAGLESVRRVITVAPDVPVIVLTGLQDEEVAIQAVRYGAQDYLEKQFISPVLLYKSIIYAIERKKILQEKEDLFQDFTKALQLIENLEGILPICMSCRKIMNEQQEWLRIEDFIKEKAESERGKLVCPSCMVELEEHR